MSQITVASAVETSAQNWNVTLAYDDDRTFVERVEGADTYEEAIDVVAQRVWDKYHTCVFRDGEQVAVSE